MCRSQYSLINSVEECLEEPSVPYVSDDNTSQQGVLEYWYRKTLQYPDTPNNQRTRLPMTLHDSPTTRATDVTSEQRGFALLPLEISTTTIMTNLVSRVSALRL